ncbi:o-succinylbenzoate synthase [Confluentibacter flavum]|uniref:O-succinylbenzoate synthase n=1 Tax=Confluentibacter flavum TaxID=1909700 RepID=A0A2N3HNP5_9FLAO|nr:o-succinylbenzoate synthase [Confluentibacter flavum]PKQ46557.1 o-succinylbenzoate synthase [Confluentibacter flavum]
MITASSKKYILNFKQPSGTSRGILKTKETWFIILQEGIKQGIGECGVFRGLSIDDRPDYEAKLEWTCHNIHLGLDALLNELIAYPSIQFGLETAFKSLFSEDRFEIFPSEFTKSNDCIPINGLIWMGSEAFMKQQIKEKIDAGFRCIKMKIGAIDFQTEINLLKALRKEFTSKEIELRVDANGAFSCFEALEKLKILSEFDLHSIEQPIEQGQIEHMTLLCQQTPLPIALDEELIGIFDVTQKNMLLQTIKPQYIILKPSLVGGFKGCDAWIDIADKKNIGWWITSALESNVGLNAIAQYTYMKQNIMPQGLGTGSLFTNNFDSPLVVKNGTLHYDNSKKWTFNL